MDRIWGLILTLIVAAPAWLLGGRIPIAGGALFALLIGVVISLNRRPELFESGIEFAARKLLLPGIALLGFGFDFGNIVPAEGKSQAFAVLAALSAFPVAWIMSRVLSLKKNTAILIAAGTAIGGVPAIALAASILDTDYDELSSSVFTVFLLTMLDTNVFPLGGQIPVLADTGQGMPVQAFLVIPLVIVLSIYTTGQKVFFEMFTAAKKPPLLKMLPWFAFGFLAASILRTKGIAGPEIARPLSRAGMFLLVIAMAGTGLKTKIRVFAASFWRPLLTGLVCWFSIAGVSVLAQVLTGK